MPIGVQDPLRATAWANLTFEISDSALTANYPHSAKNDGTGTW